MFKSAILCIIGFGAIVSANFLEENVLRLLQNNTFTTKISGAFCSPTYNVEAVNDTSFETCCGSVNITSNGTAAPAIFVSIPTELDGFNFTGSSNGTTGSFAFGCAFRGTVANWQSTDAAVGVFQNSSS